jgi:uncharacterized protein YdhG (YjbR/CyaY superfamily)
MQSHAANVETYLSELDPKRRDVIAKLREVILDNLPTGFQEEMSYGMIGYVVPLTIYPQGYHCDPTLPLPFAAVGNQKNYISFYHMGIYGSPPLKAWFTEEYRKRTGKNPDLGKSCLRLNPDRPIPYDLIGELLRKITVEDWIANVEAYRTTRNKK